MAVAQARLRGPAGDERPLPPLVELTVGRMSTADYFIDSSVVGCSRLQCTLTYVPPDHVVIVQKGSNSTRVVRSGSRDAPIVLSSKEGGVTTERLRNGDRVIIPQDHSLTIIITQPVVADNGDMVDTIHSSELVAARWSDSDDDDVQNETAGRRASSDSSRDGSDSSEQDGGVDALDAEGILVVSDESDDIDPWDIPSPEAAGTASASIPSHDADREVATRKRRARPDVKKEDEEDSDNQSAAGWREPGYRAFYREQKATLLADYGDVKPAQLSRMIRRRWADAKRVKLEAEGEGDQADESDGADDTLTVAHVLGLQQRGMMGSLTASQLRLFLQAHDIKPLSRKADMLVQVNLFLSGSAL